MNNSIHDIINRLIEIDEDVIVKLHYILPEPKSYIIIHKDYDSEEEDCFQKFLNIYELTEWVSLFGLEMTCRDIINTFNEEMIGN